MILAHLSDAEFDEFKREMRSLVTRDVPGMQDPAETVQFRRRGTGGSFTNAGAPERLLSIRLGGRQTRLEGENTGRVEHVADGELKVEEPFDVRVDDHFSWQGQPCAVTFVYPVRYGAIAADFRFLQKGGG